MKVKLYTEVVVSVSVDSMIYMHKMTDEARQAHLAIIVENALPSSVRMTKPIQIQWECDDTIV
jgi:hypothetical protein